MKATAFLIIYFGRDRIKHPHTLSMRHSAEQEHTIDDFIGS
jgi:hypothetical protein